MTDVKPTVVGSCLCGKVMFESKNEFKQFHLCHCIQCQKATGSAHASNLFTAIDNIKWLSGESLVKTYHMPGRSISNAFCTDCGGAVPYHSGTGTALIIPAGCLDTKPNIAPQDNIFCSEKASWYETAINAKEFDGFPE